MSRSKSVTSQEVAREPKPVAPIKGGAGFAADQESRQTEQASAPGSCRGIGNRPARARRHPGQAIGRASHRTGGQIKPITKLTEQEEFPANVIGERLLIVRKSQHHGEQCGKNVRMRLTFRQGSLSDGTGGRQNGKRERVIHSESGRGMDEFGAEAAELVG